MFAELPKLLDRNYLIGFFLPAVILTAAIAWLLWLFGVLAANPFAVKDGLLVAATTIGLVWVVSILLMAINVPTVRLIEGYGSRNPFALLGKWARARFARNAVPAIREQERIDTARSQGEDPGSAPGHAKALRRAVEEYPDRESLVLPTAFGNRYRAFEVYSRAVYGLDAIPAWPRLQGVMPQEYKDLLSTARARLNFCLNLQIIGGTSLTLFFLLAAGTGKWPTILPPVVGFAAMLFGYWLALGAASEYGIYVKAAFDLYRGELASKLGLDIPLDAAREREMWRQVSRMMIYRSAPAYDNLAPFRKRPKPGSKDGAARPG